MILLAHGDRRQYQLGCSCPLCKAAEARYRTHLRSLHRAGTVPLGALVAARDAARLVRALLSEAYTRRDLGAYLGCHRQRLPRLAKQRVRLRTVLRVRWGYRRLMGPE